MAIYRDVIFPRLMDWVLRGLGDLRDETLREARGDVLEVGFGTGLNLPHYPTAVSTLTVVDPMDAMRRRVAMRLAAARMPVRRVKQSGETLLFADASFDTIVTTLTLCTIPRPQQALLEMRRVLRPGGRYVFLEHGRSDDARVARWQDRLNRVQNVVACGCNLNRPIDALVREAGFQITHLDRFLAEGMPRLGGEMYRGAAQR